MSKYFLMLMAVLTLGLSACASVERSTASDEGGEQMRPTSHDRHSKY